MYLVVCKTLEQFSKASIVLRLNLGTVKGIYESHPPQGGLYLSLSGVYQQLFEQLRREL